MNDQTSIIKRIRHDLDEIRLQFNLGKAEAVDLFEKNKEELIDSIDEAKERLGQLTEPAKKKTEDLHRELDELKLQLKLGRMETSDSYHEQRDGIERAIHSIRQRLDTLDDAAGEAFIKTGEAFAQRLGAFGAKLELLALNLGAGKIDKDDELRRKREELEAELEEWSGRLESAADGTDTEAHAAWENLKSKIRKLVE